ncbi:hypothetical protein [Streptomyces sp. G1]|uniref:hypothetical protein n=1 Tax=Streptomyces sp. G1 TaxID=361572 RepID=UPI00202E0287|nr:hypothetical protein [Streptomyces sp. G1]MCM1967241.1 hypothetical protein [Streptomyces sp. G1]
MQNFSPEPGDVRVYYYNPENPKAPARWVPVKGWHIHGPNLRNPRKHGAYLPYGMPIVIDPASGMLAGVETEGPDFLGISFDLHSGSVYERVAAERLRKEQAERVEQEQAVKAARARESTAQTAAAEKAAAERAESERKTQAVISRRNNILANAEQITNEEI